MTQLQNANSESPFLAFVKEGEEHKKWLLEKHQSTRRLKRTSPKGADFVAMEDANVGYTFREVEPKDLGYGYFEDPSLAVERDENECTWFYAEVAKLNRGEPASVRREADRGYWERNVFTLLLPARSEDEGKENVAIEFLNWLRPGGPWVLTAIVPDGNTMTSTARTVADAVAFIGEHDGKRNLYYSVNPTRRAMSSKAAKTDIARIEYALGDLDPNDGETSEAAKARYLGQLEQEPEVSAAVDSGNGIQCLWKLSEPIDLAEPTKNDKGELKFSPEDQAKIDDVEARIEALMLRLGSKAGTQNIDRILRLPGTINLPNAKKLKDGRVACPTKLLWCNGAAYPLSDFPKPEANAEKPGKGKKTTEPFIDDLNDMIVNGCGDRYNGDRSKAVWSVINGMLRRGHLVETIKWVLLDRDNGISDHIYDQSDPHKYAARQVKQAVEDIEFSKDDEGRPYATANNIRIALLKMGITIRYDEFADRILIDGLYGFGPVLEDAAVDRFWLSVDQYFHFKPKIEFLYTVLKDVARINSFHPVLDYLNALQWDSKPRLDGWLTTYAGAADNAYTRAVGTLMLIAGVRRVRQPGCKFDEMMVIEQPQQGTDKSSALGILAGHDDWFSDDLPLNASGKEVIEMIRGRWILEAAELSGMRKADVEHLKAMLSRRHDRARMAYGRLAIEVPRQCVVFGTTNKSEYLRDTTGNRRFWPVLIETFDLVALRRDRDQLWAEAAAREAEGESIRLRRELWPEAAKEQKQRLADDPFVAVLAKYLGHIEGKIKAADVWEILGLHGAQLTQDAYARAAEAMKRIGWERPNTAGTAKFNGVTQVAYVRGAQRAGGRREITVTRYQGVVTVGYIEEGVTEDGRITRSLMTIDETGEVRGQVLTQVDKAVAEPQTPLERFASKRSG